MPELSTQQRLFQFIKENHSGNIALVDDVADVLGISTDSAYRRIRCEKPISLDELQLLCKHFNVSMDLLLNMNSKTVIFDVEKVDGQLNSFEKYLEGILHQLQHLQQFERKELYYVTKDIPIFHFFQFPYFMAFKYFFWMKTIVEHPDFINRQFNPAEYQDGIMESGMKILAVYNQIPSVEVWNIESINSTIQQIEFYKDSNIFTDEKQVNKLYDDLAVLISHVEKQAECGCKFTIHENAAMKAANYRLFYNRVILADNTMLAITGNHKQAFINHGVLNYMSTRQAEFCDDTYLDINNLMRRSTLISSVGEKIRSMFFNELRQQVERHQKF